MKREGAYCKTTLDDIGYSRSFHAEVGEGTSFAIPAVNGPPFSILVHSRCQPVTFSGIASVRLPETSRDDQDTLTRPRGAAAVRDSLVES